MFVALVRWMQISLVQHPSVDSRLLLPGQVYQLLRHAREARKRIPVRLGQKTKPGHRRQRKQQK